MMKGYLKDAAISLGVLSVFLMAVIAIDLAPPPDGPVMVVTLPSSGDSAIEIIAAAQGNLVSAGRWAWVATGTSNDPGFATKLKAAGALLLLRPITSACLKDPTI